MKLRVQDIREAGVLESSETVPAEAILPELPDRSSLTAPVRIEVRAEAADGEIVVLGRADTRVRLACARCLEPFESALRTDFDMAAPSAGDLVLDIAEEARQSLLLAFPSKPLCRPGCKGLCPRCGRNLNQSLCGCVAEAKETPFSKLRDFKIR